jgi:hypothetical protein
MSSQGALATAAQEWHRLWPVGANGKNIPEHRKKKRKKDKHQTNDRNKSTHSINNSSITQRDIHGHPQELADVKEFGSQMNRKPDQTIRIMLHNINRLYPLTADRQKANNKLPRG